MKVSIIMTSYNYGRFIEEAVASVLRQTHSDFELIIIDDGSTDDTPDRVKLFTDPRICSVRTVNQGVAAARNAGLDRATGAIVAGLDADDRWLPTMLERQVGLFETEPEVVASFTNFLRFDDTGKVRQKDQFTFYPELKTFPSRSARCGYGKVLLGDSFQHFLTAADSPGFTTAIAYRRDAVLTLRYNRDRAIWPVEDMQYMFSAFLLGAVAYNEEPLAELRRHGGNATANRLLIPRGKLRAFELLAEESLTPAQRGVLVSRTVRSRFEVARAHTRMGDLRGCAGTIIDAFRKPGSLSLKIRGAAGVVRWTIGNYRRQRLKRARQGLPTRPAPH